MSAFPPVAVWDIETPVQPVTIPVHDDDGEVIGHVRYKGMNQAPKSGFDSVIASLLADPARGRLIGRYIEEEPEEADDLLADLYPQVREKGMYNEALHPRDQDGRYIPKAAIARAARDPRELKRLQAMTTHPEERKKLHAAVQAVQGRVGKRGGGFMPEKVGRAVPGRQSVAETAEHIHRLRAEIGEGQPTGDHLRRLAALLAWHSVAELRELKNHLGVQVSGDPSKETAVGGIASRALAWRKEQMEKVQAERAKRQLTGRLKAEGHTGTDEHGREWENGQLVTGKKQEPHTPMDPAEFERRMAGVDPRDSGLAEVKGKDRQPADDDRDIEARAAAGDRRQRMMDWSADKPNDMAAAGQLKGAEDRVRRAGGGEVLGDEDTTASGRAAGKLGDTRRAEQARTPATTPVPARVEEKPAHEQTREEVIAQGKELRKARHDNHPVLVVDKATGKPVTEIKRSQVANLNRDKYEPRAIGGGEYTENDPTADDGWVGNVSNQHRQAVESAVKDGKTIPDKVKADYPDMFSTKPAASSSPAAVQSAGGTDYHARISALKPGKSSDIDGHTVTRGQYNPEVVTIETAGGGRRVDTLEGAVAHLEKLAGGKAEQKGGGEKAGGVQPASDDVRRQVEGTGKVKAWVSPTAALVDTGVPGLRMVDTRRPARGSEPGPFVSSGGYYGDTVDEAVRLAKADHDNYHRDPESASPRHTPEQLAASRQQLTDQVHAQKQKDRQRKLDQLKRADDAMRADGTHPDVKSGGPKANVPETPDGSPVSAVGVETPTATQTRAGTDTQAGEPHERAMELAHGGDVDAGMKELESLPWSELDKQARQMNAHAATKKATLDRVRKHLEQLTPDNRQKNRRDADENNKLLKARHLLRTMDDGQVSPESSDAAMRKHGLDNAGLRAKRTDPEVYETMRDATRNELADAVSQLNPDNPEHARLIEAAKPHTDAPTPARSGTPRMSFEQDGGDEPAYPSAGRGELFDTEGDEDIHEGPHHKAVNDLLTSAGRRFTGTQIGPRARHEDAHGEMADLDEHLNTLGGLADTGYEEIPFNATVGAHKGTVEELENGRFDDEDADDAVQHYREGEGNGGLGAGDGLSDLHQALSLNGHGDHAAWAQKHFDRLNQALEDDIRRRHEERQAPKKAALAEKLKNPVGLSEEEYDQHFPHQMWTHPSGAREWMTRANAGKAMDDLPADMEGRVSGAGKSWNVLARKRQDSHDGYDLSGVKEEVLNSLHGEDAGRGLSDIRKEISTAKHDPANPMAHPVHRAVKELEKEGKIEVGGGSDPTVRVKPAAGKADQPSGPHWSDELNPDTYGGKGLDPKAREAITELDGPEYAKLTDAEKRQAVQNIHNHATQFGVRPETRNVNIQSVKGNYELMSRLRNESEQPAAETFRTSPNDLTHSRDMKSLEKPVSWNGQSKPLREHVEDMVAAGGKVRHAFNSRGQAESSIGPADGSGESMGLDTAAARKYAVHLQNGGKTTRGQALKKTDAKPASTPEPVPARAGEAANPVMRVERDASDGDKNVRVVFNHNGKEFKSKWRGDIGQTDDELMDKALTEHRQSLDLNKPKFRSADEAAEHGKKAKDEHHALLDALTGGKAKDVVAEFNSSSGDQRQYRIEPRHDNVSGLHYVGVYDQGEDKGQELPQKRGSYEESAQEIGSHLADVRDPHDLQLHHDDVRTTHDDKKRKRTEAYQKEQDTKNAAEKKEREERDANESARQHFEQKYGGLKTKKGQIQLAVHGGGKGEVVDGHVVGPFTVHRDEMTGPQGNYTVTHTKTGMGTGVRSFTLAGAKQAAAILSDHGNWDIDGKTKKIDTETAKHGLAVKKAFEKGDYAGLKKHMDEVEAKKAGRPAPVDAPAQPPAASGPKVQTGNKEDDLRLGELRRKAAHGRGMTHGDEMSLKLLEAKAAADHTKWKEGDGVGYKVYSGGKASQTNKGFQVVSVDPETKTAVIRQVADTGLTSSGGDNDRFGNQTVHIADLVRDNKYNRRKPDDDTTGTPVPAGSGPKVGGDSGAVEPDAGIAGKSAAPWHGNREEVFEQMRKIEDEHEQHRRNAQKFAPKQGQIGVGSQDFDHHLKAEVAMAFNRALRKGKTPQEATEYAKEEAKATVKNWNAKGSKHRASVNGNHENQRWEGSGDAYAEDLGRRFRGIGDPSGGTTPTLDAGTPVPAENRAVATRAGTDEGGVPAVKPASTVEPNSVMMIVRDRDGEEIGRIAAPHDGTTAGMKKAANELTERAEQEYGGEWSNVNSTTGASDHTGTPKFVISPNRNHVNPIESDAGKYSMGLLDYAPKGPPAALPGGGRDAIRASTNEGGETPREPWQMTKDEYHAQKRDEMKRDYPQLTGERLEQATRPHSDKHGRLVQEAAARGERIPDDVLDSDSALRDRITHDYPDTHADYTPPEVAAHQKAADKEAKIRRAEARTAAPAAPEQLPDGQKHPWQMTKAEHDRHVEENDPKAEKIRQELAVTKGRDRKLVQDRLDRHLASQKSKHSTEVGVAVDLGRDVPPEVLADYPHLATPTKRSFADKRNKARMADLPAHVQAGLSDHPGHHVIDSDGQTATVYSPTVEKVSEGPHADLGQTMGDLMGSGKKVAVLDRDGRGADEPAKPAKKKGGKAATNPEAHRVADKLAKRVVGDIARNGFTAGNDDFASKFNDMEDADKKAVVKELHRRGLVSDITARQRKFLGRAVADEVAGKAKGLHTTHGMDPTNRHVPFHESDAYRKAFGDDDTGTTGITGTPVPAGGGVGDVNDGKVGDGKANDAAGWSPPDTSHPSYAEHEVTGPAKQQRAKLLGRRYMKSGEAAEAHRTHSPKIGDVYTDHDGVVKRVTQVDGRPILVTEDNIDDGLSYGQPGWYMHWKAAPVTSRWHDEGGNDRDPLRPAHVLSDPPGIMANGRKGSLPKYAQNGHKTHKDFVESLYKQGKTVSPESVARYPDLAAKYGKSDDTDDDATGSGVPAGGPKGGDGGAGTPVVGGAGKAGEDISGGMGMTGRDWLAGGAGGKVEDKPTRAGTDDTARADAGRPAEPAAGGKFMSGASDKDREFAEGILEDHRTLDGHGSKPTHRHIEDMLAAGGRPHAGSRRRGAVVQIQRGVVDKNGGFWDFGNTGHDYAQHVASGGSKHSPVEGPPGEFYRKLQQDLKDVRSSAIEPAVQAGSGVSGYQDIAHSEQTEGGSTIHHLKSGDGLHVVSGENGHELRRQVMGTAPGGVFQSLGKHDTLDDAVVAAGRPNANEPEVDSKGTANGQEVDSKPPADQNAPYTLAEHDATTERLHSGKITPDELRQAHARLQQHRDAVQGELKKRTVPELKKLAGHWRASDMNKPELLKYLHERMGEELVPSTGDARMISIGHNYDTIKEQAERLGQTTDEHIQTHAGRMTAALEERKKRIETLKESVANPKTLEDYQRLARTRGGLDKLTPEELERHDELHAEARRGRSMAERQEKAKIAGFSGGEQAAGGIDIVQGRHQKRGEDTHTVTVANRLGDEKFQEALSAAKRLGGSYVNAMIAKRYNATPGFQFFDRGKAEQFAAVLRGESVDRSGDVAGEMAARQQNRAGTVAEKAESLIGQGEESLGRERRSNTRRQAEMAASAEAQAREKIATGKTLQRIGDGQADGTLKHLNGVRSAEDLHTLDRALRFARYERMRQAKGPDGAALSYREREALEHEPHGTDDFPHMEYPHPSAHQSELQDIGRMLADEPGLKRFAEKMKKEGDPTADVKFSGTVGGMKANGGVLRYAHHFKDHPEAKYIAHHMQGDGEGDKAVRVHYSNDWRLAQAAAKGDPTEKHFGGFYTADKGKSWAKSAEDAVTGAIRRGNVLDHIDAPREKSVKFTDPDDVEALRKAARKLRNHPNDRLRRIGQSLKEKLEHHDRLKRADIHSLPELRAALREYLPLKTAADKEDPVKKAERDLKGKDIPGFFPTPRPAVEEMLDRADIQPGHTVLEPSAGKGDILDAIRERHPDAQTHALEYNSTLRDILQKKGHNVVGNDALDHVGQYDRIVMNPPFESGADRDHVRHQYENNLAPGGRMVGIMSEGPFSRQSAKDQEFRDWLESVGGTHEEMPEGSFAGNDAFRKTGVRTRMVTIDKPG